MAMDESVGTLEAGVIDSDSLSASKLVAVAGTFTDDGTKVYLALRSSGDASSDTGTADYVAGRQPYSGALVLGPVSVAPDATTSVVAAVAVNGDGTATLPHVTSLYMTAGTPVASTEPNPAIATGACLNTGQVLTAGVAQAIDSTVPITAADTAVYGAGLSFTSASGDASTVTGLDLVEVMYTGAEGSTGPPIADPFAAVGPWPPVVANVASDNTQRGVVRRVDRVTGRTFFPGGISTYDGYSGNYAPRTAVNIAAGGMTGIWTNPLPYLLGGTYSIALRADTSAHMLFNGVTDGVVTANCGGSFGSPGTEFSFWNLAAARNLTVTLNYAFAAPIPALVINPGQVGRFYIHYLPPASLPGASTWIITSRVN